jgi:uncharacterized protein YndB with AHSA1/START domain
VLPDDSQDAIREVAIAATPSEVWDALVDPVALAAWFGAEVELEPREGAPVRFRFPDGSERRGLVQDVVPGRRLTWRWRELHGAGLGLVVGQSSTVTLDLVTEDEHTVVRVTEVTEPRASWAHAGSGGIR